ncbi:unnamed protein product [Boreogadus saida]
MEQRLSRGVLLEMEEEDGHGEDQASGGYPPEGSDLTAVRRLLEREASKQEQRWRSSTSSGIGTCTSTCTSNCTSSACDLAQGGHSQA